MYSNTELLFIIFIIGLATLFLRSVFLYAVPRVIHHPVVKRGMDAVPASMLVALVVPFTIFIDQELSIFRPEVYAMMISIPIIYLSKKYSYGLIIAIICYILLILPL